MVIELTGLSPFIVRGFINENSSKFIGFCKDESLSDDEFFKLLDELDFNELAKPELIGKFRL